MRRSQRQQVGGESWGTVDGTNSVEGVVLYPYSEAHGAAWLSGETIPAMQPIYSGKHEISNGTTVLSGSCNLVIAGINQLHTYTACICKLGCVVSCRKDYTAA